MYVSCLTGTYWQLYSVFIQSYNNQLNFATAMNDQLCIHSYVWPNFLRFECTHIKEYSKYVQPKVLRAEAEGTEYTVPTYTDMCSDMCSWMYSEPETKVVTSNNIPSYVQPKVLTSTNMCSAMCSWMYSHLPICAVEGTYSEPEPKVLTALMRIQEIGRLCAAFSHN